MKPTARPALLLALGSVAFGATSLAVLTDDQYRVPPGRWVRFEIGNQPATVQCNFDTAKGGEARAELVTLENLELFRQHKAHDVLAASEDAQAGSFSRYVRGPGQYAVVIENTGDQPTAVHLRVLERFGDREPVSRQLPPERRLTVILLSFAGFFAIVTLSGRALLKAMKRP